LGRWPPIFLALSRVMAKNMIPLVFLLSCIFTSCSAQLTCLYAGAPGAEPTNLPMYPGRACVSLCATCISSNPHCTAQQVADGYVWPYHFTLDQGDDKGIKDQLATGTDYAITSYCRYSSYTSCPASGCPNTKLVCPTTASKATCLATTSIPASQTATGKLNY
jgi:hypothetical protein